MALEDLTGVAKFISALNPAWPVDDDFLDEGDNHVRGIKNVLRNTFPGLAGAVTLTHDQLNAAGLVSRVTVAPVNAVGAVEVAFLGLPAGIQELTLYLNGISTNAEFNLLVQLGTPAGWEVAGYVGCAWQGGSVDTVASDATAFVLTAAHSAGSTSWGMASIELMDNASSTWIQRGALARGDGVVPNSAGRKTLAGALDRVRLTTLGSTFDAGTVGLSYRRG